MRSIKAVVVFVAVMMAGLIAGLMWGTGMDQYTFRVLPSAEWVHGHQVVDTLFRRVMPPIWNAGVLLLIVAAVVERGRARWLLAAAAVLLGVSLVLTVSLEVPMNAAIAHWSAAAPPAQWAEVRDRWLRIHLVRTLLAVVAFGCATAALMTGARTGEGARVA